MHRLKKLHPNAFLFFTYPPPISKYFSDFSMHFLKNWSQALSQNNLSFFDLTHYLWKLQNFQTLCQKLESFSSSHHHPLALLISKTIGNQPMKSMIEKYVPDAMIDIRLVDASLYWPHLMLMFWFISNQELDIVTRKQTHWDKTLDILMDLSEVNFGLPFFNAKPPLRGDNLPLMWHTRLCV